MLSRSMASSGDVAHTETTNGLESASCTAKRRTERDDSPDSNASSINVIRDLQGSRLLRKHHATFMIALSAERGPPAWCPGDPPWWSREPVHMASRSCR